MSKKPPQGIPSFRKLLYLIICNHTGKYFLQIYINLSVLPSPVEIVRTSKGPPEIDFELSLNLSYVEKTLKTMLKSCLNKGRTDVI